MRDTRTTFNLNLHSLLILLEVNNKLKSFHTCILFLDFEHKTELHFVRIYFDTPPFDRITKDSRMKLSDMVGTVGGTMGLLTGFSIISAVEIFYFATKIFSKLYRSIMK